MSISLILGGIQQWRPRLSTGLIVLVRHVLFFAYRLIARNTVEEKILALQDQKRELAASIISADTGILSGLTTEDVEMLLS